MGHPQHVCPCQQPITEPAAGLAGDRVLLWPPIVHTAGKLASVAEELALHVEWGSDRTWLSVRVPERDALDRFLGLTSQHLTEEELESTLALVGTDTSPTPREIPAIRSLRKLIAATQRAWFTDILTNGSLTCAFQPIVSAVQRDIVGHEALLRARRSDGTIVTAAQLLSAAKVLDKLVQLDVQARITALEEFATHKLEGLVFVNFTPTAVYDPRTCLQSTWNAARRHGIDPRRVVFEVIESESLPNLKHVHDVLAAYRERGFRVALDDVGSGYSSLAWFTALRPDFVKIDRHLTHGLSAEPIKRAVVTKIVELCRTIGAQVIAEGIETPEDAAAAAEVGVDYVQGYLFGYPRILSETTVPS